MTNVPQLYKARTVILSDIVWVLTEIPALVAVKRLRWVMPTSAVW
jgi:hypothetical protein